MTRRHLVDDEYIRPEFFALQRKRKAATKAYLRSQEDSPEIEIPKENRGT